MEKAAICGGSRKSVAGFEGLARGFGGAEIVALICLLCRSLPLLFASINQRTAAFVQYKAV